MSPSLEDLLSEKSKSKIKYKEEIGSILMGPFDENDDITPQNGEKSHDKRFIIIGHDIEGNAVGIVIINSPHINKQSKDISAEIRGDLYPLLQSKNPKALTKNCHAQCYKIRPLSKERLEKCNYLDKINERDLDCIIDLVKKSESIEPKHKKRFGLI